MATFNTKAIGEPATQPSYVQAVATGPTQPTLSQSEWKNSRVISEDLQRGTISLQYLVDGTPDEVWAGSGTGGFQLGHTAPPWFPSSFLVARQFEHHVYGDGSTSTAKTMATYTYQKRPCFGLYEEDFNISLVGYQCVWSHDNPPRKLGNVVESFNILLPQIVYRRRWPNVRMTAFEMQNLQLLSGKTSTVGFLSQPPGFWLIEGIQAKLLYGKSQQGSIEPANWDLSIVFRGDSWRRHETWLYNPEANRPETNSFDDLRAAHFVLSFYPRVAVDFDSLVSTGANLPGDCLPDAP